VASDKWEGRDGYAEWETKCVLTKWD